jgi:hypothetical protein
VLPRQSSCQTLSKPNSLERLVHEERRKPDPMEFACGTVMMKSSVAAGCFPELLRASCLITSVPAVCGMQPDVSIA